MLEYLSGFFAERVCDKWGNENGLDGELSEGQRIYVVHKKN
jgi:hypothetical protein